MGIIDMLHKKNTENAEKDALLVEISKLCTYMEELKIFHDTIYRFLLPKLNTLVNTGKIDKHYLDSLRISLDYKEKHGGIDKEFIKTIAKDMDDRLNRENSEAPQVSSPEQYSYITASRKFRDFLQHSDSYTSPSDQNPNKKTPPSRDDDPLYL